MFEVINKGGVLCKVGWVIVWVGKKWVWIVIGDWCEVCYNVKWIYNLLKFFMGCIYWEESFLDVVFWFYLSEKDFDVCCWYLYVFFVLFGLMVIVVGVFFVLVFWLFSFINYGFMFFGVFVLSIICFLVIRF